MRLTRVGLGESIGSEEEGTSQIALIALYNFSVTLHMYFYFNECSSCFASSTTVVAIETLLVVCARTYGYRTYLFLTAVDY